MDIERHFRRAGAAALLSALCVLSIGAAAPSPARAGHPAAGRPGGHARAAAAARTGRVVLGGAQLASRGVVVNYPPGAHSRRLPAVPAAAFVIADAGTGEVLAAKDPHGKYAPASTLKVLTAIALMPVLSPGEDVRASRWAADTEPSKVGLLAGHSYKVADLFKALLMISANDAAVSLAQATGSYQKGMEIINAQARHLRADDTVAKRPNGLDARGQHASAYDEALWARAALAIPQFMRDESQRTARFPLRRHHWITLYNQNTMLATFPGDLGGKIGWTTPAKATFIGWARRQGHTLVVTILHATPLTELDTAAKLLNWGFAMDGKVRPVGVLVSPLPAAARGHTGSRGRQAPGGVAAHAAAIGTPALLIGIAALAAALLAGAGTIAAARRSRAAGNRRAR